MLLRWILSLLGTNAGSQVAGGVINSVASIAVLAPVALWFIEHKDEPFVTLSYGESAIIGGLLFVVIKAAHWSQPPPRPQWPPT